MQHRSSVVAGFLLSGAMLATAFAAPAPKPTAAKPVAAAKAVAARTAVTKPVPAVGSVLTELDRVLAAENAEKNVKVVAPRVDDLPFLRRVSIDLIGRIPTEPEIQEYLSWPAAERRGKLIDKLLADSRFADRWAVFFADMLRIRAGAEGGNALLAFVHQAIDKGMPYDLMCQQLIAANGRANLVPEVGFILGDGADPMALAGATSQTFLGIRIACAQCHDHPFDVWTREQFYGLAAYFGKTTRVERRFKNNLLGVYTTDVERTSILWPPEGVGAADARKPMSPEFPFALESSETPARHIERLVALRKAQADLASKKADAEKATGPNLDDLLAEAEKKVKKTTQGPGFEDDAVFGEAKSDVRSIKLQQDQFRMSQLRHELARLVANPRNRAFSRSFVNRVWAELVGRGFVDPIDDFSETNVPSHPQTLDYLADEFVASGYDLRSLLKMIVSSEVYQRSRLDDVDEPTRREAELVFASAPMRRMISEVLYDSIVLAGHLFEVKHEAGKNLKTDWVLQQIPKEAPGAKGTELASALKTSGGGEVMAGEAMPGKPAAGGVKYDLESALELDFAAVLKAKGEDDEPEVEEMRMVSKEELEAEEEMRRMAMARRNVSFVDRYVRTIIDDNPRFTSALRMASPMAPSHFLRIFGQPARDALGQFRDHSASMRQSLLILNGRLTNEAARVGELEPVYALASGPKPKLKDAVELIYLEILTRKPSADELKFAEEIVASSDGTLNGIADLRWALFNSHEFRFLP